MTEDTVHYSTSRKPRLSLRRLLIGAGTWSTLALGLVAIVLYTLGVHELALVATGMSCFALSLAIRTYGLVTMVNSTAYGAPIKPARSAK